MDRKILARPWVVASVAGVVIVGALGIGLVAGGAITARGSRAVRTVGASSIVGVVVVAAFAFVGRGGFVARRAGVAVSAAVAALARRARAFGGVGSGASSDRSAIAMSSSWAVGSPTGSPFVCAASLPPTRHERDAATRRTLIWRSSCILRRASGASSPRSGTWSDAHEGDD